MNWKMTAKTTLVQLHHKVRTFEALGHRLVLVLQDELLSYLKREFAFGHVGPASDNDPMLFHAYSVFSGSPASSGLRLVERLSTDTEGVRRCLDLQADARVDTEHLLSQLSRKLKPARSSAQAGVDDTTPGRSRRLRALSANVRDTAGLPLNSGGHTLARRIDGKTRSETWRQLGAPGPGG